MKWFSFSAIIKEISKIRWPKKDDLLTNSVQVLLFVGFFALFFLVCQLVISFILKTIGVL